MCSSAVRSSWKDISKGSTSKIQALQQSGQEDMITEKSHEIYLKVLQRVWGGRFRAVMTMKRVVFWCNSKDYRKWSAVDYPYNTIAIIIYGTEYDVVAFIAKAKAIEIYQN